MSLSFKQSAQQTVNQNSSNENIGVAVVDLVETDDWVLDDKYPYYYEYSDENESVIDEHKSINFNSAQSSIVQEVNAQIIPFRMNRFYDGYDLHATQIMILFQNKNGKSDFDTPINVYYNNNYIKFSWKLDGRVTQFAGEIKFEIQARGTNSKGDMYIWRSLPNGKFNVIQSLSYNGIEEPEENWLDVFLSQISSNSTSSQLSAKESNMWAENAMQSAESAQASALEAIETVQQTREVLENLGETIETKTTEKVNEKVNKAMENYYVKKEVNLLISNVNEIIDNNQSQNVEQFTSLQDLINNYKQILDGVKEDVDVFFDGADFSENAKDILKELQEYIVSDAENAAILISKINDNKTNIEEMAEVVGGVVENVTKLAEDVDKLKTEVNGNVEEQIKLAKEEAVSTAKTYTDEKINKADSDILSLTARIASLENNIDGVGLLVTADDGSVYKLGIGIIEDTDEVGMYYEQVEDTTVQGKDVLIVGDDGLIYRLSIGQIGTTEKLGLYFQLAQTGTENSESDGGE